MIMSDESGVVCSIIIMLKRVVDKLEAKQDGGVGLVGGSGGGEEGVTNSSLSKFVL